MAAEPQHFQDNRSESAPARLFWGCHDSPLGPVLIAVTPDNILCRLEFASGYGLGYDLSEWKREWPGTDFVADAVRSSAYASQFAHLSIQGWGRSSLALYGRAFVLKVWKAMLQARTDNPMNFMEVSTLLQKAKAA